MTILLVRLRLIGDVVFTTPFVRELRRRYPAARMVYVVETGAAPVVRGNPHLDEVITIAHSRGWRRLRDDLRLARRLRRERFDLADRPARRAAQRVADAGPSGAPRARRLRHHGARLDVHAPRAPAARVAPAAFGRESVGSAAGDRRDVHDAGRSRARCAWKWRSSAEAIATIDRRLAAAGVAAGDAHRPAARERRQSVSAMAGIVVRRARGGPVGRRARPMGVRHQRSIRPRGRRARRRRREATRQRRRRRASSTPKAGRSRNCARRSTARRSSSAATAVRCTSRPRRDVPIVGLYGPTLPERSAPWRSPRLLTASVDAGALPCRPCDQRVCVTADFRCLSGIPASRVLREAERLLAEHDDHAIPGLRIVMPHRVIRQVSLAATIAAALWTAYLVFVGGFDLPIGRYVFSSHEPIAPDPVGQRHARGVRVGERRRPHGGNLGASARRACPTASSPPDSRWRHSSSASSTPRPSRPPLTPMDT